MIGIYKITSPNNRVYIGQSNNIKKRFKEYKSLNNCKGQIKLYRSFLKYGVINHTFKIIEECTVIKLNEKERHWQEHYKCVESGLNCFLTKTNEKPRIMSQEYKDKIKKTLLYKYKTKEITCHNKGKGRKFNVYDYKGNILYKNIDIENIIIKLNLSNRSVINNILKVNRFLSQKQYIIIPIKNHYFDFISNCIRLNKGLRIPVYQIFKSGEVEKCSGASKYKITKKLLNSKNLTYYSKKNKSYYTFIGLINAVQKRNFLNN